MKESPFGVTYIYGTTYLEPVVIAKSIIVKNTYKYKHYPETPPGSPNLNPIKNEIDIVDENNNDTDGSVISVASSKSSTDAVNYSMESILDTAKYIFTKHDPNNNELLQHIYSLRQFSLLLNKHKDHFGVQTQKKVSRNKLPCFKEHIQNSDGEWINIGYVRKSPADESGETRDILVRKMVSKLINIGFCEKIYVSSCSSAQYPIFKRDFEIEHKYGDGNTQDFL
ncbi:hypothetical protein G6F57_012858 [Rhizopus arrhizus]|uniref:Uncharacterized protein n=1 Tax=Rhizopus oryzae TaxID=64495 RepID=A0A9P6WYT5_RHIOR|nr:hypothetical protein G6F23_010330 [Rhizopus arrhizus]KAG0929450.1 hypothetical protein G6F30_012006 [Rhizopus arrhizus]KAG0937162.1 hypothetical protein G6F32_009860 [Rhizopus arrhizus]KAG0974591.1 hypothetical protein G6F29_012111 [Rhizopus arrhizus]KAG0978815.1 hypothetical protein G6F28_012040 [Rhizopus arrhizus]